MNACDLFDSARLPARDADGRLTHPDFSLVVFVEDEVDVAPFFNGAGLELRSVAHECPEDDHDGVDLSWVTPEAPGGDGWRLVSIHDNEDGEAIVWWTRYIGPAASTARIVGARVIDGVHVIVAQPASRLLPEQLLVRYDDYLVSRLAISAAAAQDGASLISAERSRQISAEGWSAEHDDAHADLALVRAAVAYALYGISRRVVDDSFWPWHLDWWKPSDRVRNLVKAGALIAAEIDRLHRAAAAPVPAADQKAT
ncbi:hypothetical protein [Luteimonas fraxinea]|uniref:Uncharacterized protein n=1 Tax=Luteimonas fraxinea TaxID=2901869 RepID=A0ABS8UC59_9GAMM|nr:hypothetical protein [Luteimonas fraxinea]MCD9097078.1 hypothetical protein [Luteimonas fraxinea]